jgi:hypothetical protein
VGRGAEASPAVSLPPADGADSVGAVIGLRLGDQVDGVDVGLAPPVVADRHLELGSPALGPHELAPHDFLLLLSEVAPAPVIILELPHLGTDADIVKQHAAAAVAMFVVCLFWLPVIVCRTHSSFQLPIRPRQAATWQCTGVVWLL